MRLTDIAAAAPTLDGAETVLGVKTGGAVLLPYARPASFGRRAALLGDSIVAYNTYASNQGGSGYYPNGAGSTEVDNGQAGFFTAFSQLTGQRLSLDPVMNRGIGGQTTTQMLARFDADVAANYAAFDWLFLMGGTNDPSAGVAKETTLANLQAMVLAALRNGKAVALFTILPRNSSSWTSGATANMRRILWVNSQLRSWTARLLSAGAPLHLIDAFGEWANPASTITAAASGYTVAPGVAADGLHPSGYGAYLIGRRMADTLGPFLPAPVNAGMGAIDGFDATDNPGGVALLNPVFATATGGTATAVTAAGGIPANWSVTQTAGSGSPTASEVAVSTLAPEAAGYGARQGAKLQVAVSVASGQTAVSGQSYSNVVRLRSDNVVHGSFPGFWTPGATYQLSARLKLSGLAGYAGAALTLQASPAGAASYTRIDGSPNISGATSWGQDDQTLTLATPLFSFAEAIGASPFGLATLYLYFDARTAAAAGVVQISDLQLRRIG